MFFISMMFVIETLKGFLNIYMNHLFFYDLIYDFIMNHIIIYLILYGYSGESLYEIFISFNMKV